MIREIKFKNRRKKSYFVWPNERNNKFFGQPSPALTSSSSSNSIASTTHNMCGIFIQSQRTHSSYPTRSHDYFFFFVCFVHTQTYVQALILEHRCFAFVFSLASIVRKCWVIVEKENQSEGRVRRSTRHCHRRQHYHREQYKKKGNFFFGDKWEWKRDKSTQ